MRLSEVLGMEALDQRGNVLGEVHDVRLRQEATDAGGSRRLVVDGFLVGVGSVGARLGYAYGEVAGPWPLAWFLRRLARGARYVPWQDVASFDGSRLVVAVSAEALMHPLDHQRGER